MYRRYLETSIVPICAARDVFGQMQRDGELISKAVDVAADGLTYSWRAACDAFDIVPHAVPTHRL